MVTVCSDWPVEVERGPNWLFVRLLPGDGDRAPANGLAEALWALLDKHFIYRLVLELDDTPLISSELVEQIRQLRAWIDQRGGRLRLCGAGDQVRAALQDFGVDPLNCCGSRNEALLGAQGSAD